MNKTNYCVGCVFNGTINGAMPECSNCPQKDKAIVASIKTENANAADMMAEFVDELLPADADTSQSVSNKAVRRERRAVAKRYDSKTPKTLGAAFVYEMSFDFPVCKQKTLVNSGIVPLTSQLKSWQRKAESTEMKMALQNVSIILNKVQQCGGEIIASHRYGDILHLTIGFREKCNWLDFRQKTA